MATKDRTLAAQSSGPMLFIASDHAGFDLKNFLLTTLPVGPHGFTWKDFGPPNADRVDYPDFAQKVCRELITRRADESKSGTSLLSLAILICGSGQGMAMSANRHREIRAAIAWSLESAELARAHNDANVLCLGARLIEPALAVRLVEKFLATPFEGGRHSGRLEKLDR